MKFYSGFALVNDEALFKSWLREGDYSVAGFSYGAIEAFEYAYASKARIDTLQLFSPAFFQTKPKRYKTMQLEAFKKDRLGYLGAFLHNCYYPAKVQNLLELDKEATAEDLERLLFYEWDRARLEALKSRGVEIEVYLGEADKIIDAAKAKAFFQAFATIYWLPSRGHFLLKD